MAIEVLGVSQVLGRFLKAAALGDVAVESATSIMANDVAEAARRNAPVRTGTLRDSIGVEGNAVVVGAPYAVEVEYGTSDTDAQPFLRPAEAEENGSHALAIAAAIIGRA